MSKPPFTLVSLDTLPVDLWKGRAVFHPSLQMDGVPDWEDEDGTYDVGVVVEWRDHMQLPGHKDVTFVCFSGSTLHYGDYNLWTPVTSDLEKLAALGEISEDAENP
jgi:hypothetical protein